MKRKFWEYVSERFDGGANRSLDEWLCKFGAAGYELVAVRDERYYFKRESSGS